MRVNQLGEGTLANHVRMLVWHYAAHARLLFVRLRGSLLFRLLVTSRSITIIAFIRRARSALTIIILNHVLILNHCDMLLSLLVKNRIVYRLLLGCVATNYPISISSILKEESLTIGLLQAWVIYQNLLLLCKIAGLSINVTSNESSSASGNFHEVLREFLIILLKSWRRFIVFLSTSSWNVSSYVGVCRLAWVYNIGSRGARVQCVRLICMSAFWSRRATM